nr:uncharacterized protein LOC109421528 [Aedes albopictus]
MDSCLSICQTKQKKCKKCRSAVSPVPEANVNRHKRKGKNVCARCKWCVPEHHVHQTTIFIVCGRKSFRPDADGDNATCLSLELQSQKNEKDVAEEFPKIDRRSFGNLNDYVGRSGAESREGWSVNGKHQQQQ